MSVLYQKYRPQKFSEVYGQQHIKVAIQNQIASGKTAHAYLFCGPRAVGKTTIARLLAKAVNCEKRKEGESEPCGECLSCEEIRRGNALDIMEIDAASHTGVDNVRENIIANARVSPSKSKYKVFIIDEVHMLSVSAFNALLKTLEEPPENVIFILATTEIHKVPGTIISRCQRYDFKKISAKKIIQNLNYIVSEEGITVDDCVLNNIAIESEGCLRDAQSLLGQVLFLGDKHITAQSAEIVIPRSNLSILADFAEFLLSNNIEKAIYFINNLLQEGNDLTVFTKNFVEFLRKVILVKIGSGLDYFSIEFDEETEKRILKIAEGNNINKVIRAVELFLEAAENLKKCEIAPLSLELAVLKFAEGIKQKLEIRPSNTAGKNWKLEKQGGKEDKEGEEWRDEIEEIKKLEIKKLEKQEGKEDKERGKGREEEIKELKNSPHETKRAILQGKEIESSAIKAGQELEIEEGVAEYYRDGALSRFREGEEGCRDKALPRLRGEDCGKDKELPCLGNAQNGGIDLKIEEVLKRWGEVIEGIKKYNHSMCFILKISKPFEVSGNILKLAHSHEFHQERVQDMKNKQSLEAVLKEIFNHDLLIESIVDVNLSKDFNSGNSESPGIADENAEIGNLTPAIKAGQELEIGEAESNMDVDQAAGDIKNREQNNNLLQDILSEMGGEVVN